MSRSRDRDDGIRIIGYDYTTGYPITDYRHKLEAALLAFLGGFVGMHKFYLGRIGVGMIYALFFWTLIPAIISFFEGIYYVCVSRMVWDYKYNYRYYLIHWAKRY